MQKRLGQSLESVRDPQPVNRARIAKSVSLTITRHPPKSVAISDPARTATQIRRRRPPADIERSCDGRDHRACAAAAAADNVAHKYGRTSSAHHLRDGSRRARPMISPVTAAFNIGGRPTATYLCGRSSGIGNGDGFRWMGE